MFKFLSRQAFEAVPTPRPVLRLSASRHAHSMRVPYTGPPSYDTIARRFSSLQVDPRKFFTRKRTKWISPYEQQKKKMPKYFSMIILRKRLGFWIDQLKAMPVARMLENENYSLDGEGRDGILKTKEKVYDNIVEFLDIEGYPTEANANFQEANVIDLVYAIVSPILFDFRSRTGRKKVWLQREREIISTDNETGGTEEFVVIDRISVKKQNFVLIIAARKRTTGEVLKQCLLSLKDARDNNGGGVVYGFITTGEVWRMVSYNGTFQVTRKMEVLFDGVDEEREGWMKENSVLVDCIYVALSNGGIVKND